METVDPIKPKSRKDLLKQFKENKQAQSNKSDNSTLKSKVKVLGNTTNTAHTTTSIKGCKPIDKKKVEVAGKKCVAPNTPIGKLQQRLKLMNTPKEESSFLAHSSPIVDHEYKHVNITSYLDEAKLLAGSAGIQVARAFLLELPNNKGMSYVLKKAVYWLTWIELEKKNRQWDYVDNLYVRANGLVENHADKFAIFTSYQLYREETDKQLNTSLNQIDNNNSDIYSPGRDGDELDGDGHTNSYSNSDTSAYNIRDIMNGGQEEEEEDQTADKLPQNNPLLDQNISLFPGYLAGGNSNRATTSASNSVSRPTASPSLTVQVNSTTVPVEMKSSTDSIGLLWKQKHTGVFENVNVQATRSMFEKIAATTKDSSSSPPGSPSVVRVSPKGKSQARVKQIVSSISHQAMPNVSGRAMGMYGGVALPGLANPALNPLNCSGTSSGTDLDTLLGYSSACSGEDDDASSYVNHSNISTVDIPTQSISESINIDQSRRTAETVKVFRPKQSYRAVQVSQHPTEEKIQNKRKGNETIKDQEVNEVSEEVEVIDEATIKNTEKNSKVVLRGLKASNKSENKRQRGTAISFEVALGKDECGKDHKNGSMSFQDMPDNMQQTPGAKEKKIKSNKRKATPFKDNIAEISDEQDDIVLETKGTLFGNRYVTLTSADVSPTTPIIRRSKRLSKSPKLKK